MRAVTLSLILASSPLLPHGADAAIVVTYRGDGENVLYPHEVGATDFDINGDGTDDYRFSSNGFFASLDTFGSNRVSAFIDQTGFYSHQIVPVGFGFQIGPTSSFPYFSLAGAWHSANEVPNYTNGFLLGYGTSGFMQFEDSHIGVEFWADDGIHYGWIQYTGFSVAQFPVYSPEGMLLGYIQGIDQPGGLVDSWAWETEPGVPIFAGQIPEPAPCVQLCIGLATMLAGRHRKPRQNKSLLTGY